MRSSGADRGTETSGEGRAPWLGQASPARSTLRSKCLALSNEETVDRDFLSINSVMTYIRTAYAKIGVHARSQAVLWVLPHGFAPPAEHQSTVQMALMADVRKVGGVQLHTLRTIHVRGPSSISVGPRRSPAGVRDEDRIEEPEDTDDVIGLTPEEVRDAIYPGPAHTYN